MELQKGEAQVREQHFSLCTANALNSFLQAPYFFVTASRSDCLLAVGLLEELCNSPGCTKSGSAETLRSCPSIQWPHLLGVLGGEKWSLPPREEDSEQGITVQDPCTAPQPQCLLRQADNLPAACTEPASLEERKGSL